MDAKRLLACGLVLAGTAGASWLARRWWLQRTAAEPEAATLTPDPSDRFGEPRGPRQDIDWVMSFPGGRRVIPTLWEQEGKLVFDLLTIPDPKQAEDYFREVRGLDEEALSPAELAALLARRPIMSAHLTSLKVDGQQHDHSGHGTTFGRLDGREEPRAAALRRLYPGYLRGVRWFGVMRFTLSAPEPLRLPVSRLEVTFGPERETLPMKQEWTLPLDGSPAMVTFEHPVTGRQHALYLQPGETEKLEAGTAFPMPVWVSCFDGEVVPPLPGGGTLQFDTSLCAEEQQVWDELRRSQTPPYAPEARGAASIGIIGGADGPTALVFGRRGKEGEELGPHGQPLVDCPARMTGRAPCQATLALQGISVELCPGSTHDWRAVSRGERRLRSGADWLNALSGRKEKAK